MAVAEYVTCPYCGQPTKLVDSATIYNGQDYGPIYHCRPCDAYVGCHKGTTRPLGTPANWATRQARKRAHAAFDPIWRERIGPYGFRYGAYGWLRRKLGLKRDDCHIAMFDEGQCVRVVELSEAYKRQYKGVVYTAPSRQSRAKRGTRR